MIMVAVSTHSLSALIISGGHVVGSGTVYKAEVYVPSTGQQCYLPNMLKNRWSHTMEEKTVCGSRSFKRSCFTLADDGTWQETTSNLLEER